MNNITDRILSGYLWVSGFGLAGMVAGLLAGWIGEKLDSTHTIDIPGVLIASSMVCGGLIGVAIGAIVLQLKDLRRINEEQSK